MHMHTPPSTPVALHCHVAGPLCPHLLLHREGQGRTGKAAGMLSSGPFSLGWVGLKALLPTTGEAGGCHLPRDLKSHSAQHPYPLCFSGPLGPNTSQRVGPAWPAAGHKPLGPLQCLREHRTKRIGVCAQQLLALRTHVKGGAQLWFHMPTENSHPCSSLIINIRK